MNSEPDFLQMMKDANKFGFAAAAFNAYNLETFQAVLQVYQSTQVPVIIALGEKYFSNMRPKTAAGLLRSLLGTFGVEGVYGRRVGLHLDHAMELDSCFEAIAAGFSSVMIDASHKPFEQNIELTRLVVQAAHEQGVGVEAELGGLAAGRDSHEFQNGTEVLTDPEQAETFVRATGVDVLAVSVGTVHGMYKGEPHLDLNRLQEISERVGIPLVLHGGSGTPPELLAKAIRLGIAKVNVNTEVSLAGVRAIQQTLTTLTEKKLPHLSELGLQSRAAMIDVMTKYVQLLQPEREF